MAKIKRNEKEIENWAWRQKRSGIKKWHHARGICASLSKNKYQYLISVSENNGVAWRNNRNNIA